MERKLLNRIKVVLAEKTNNKWLSQNNWIRICHNFTNGFTNTTQPNVEMLIQITKVLDVSVDDLLRTE